MKNKSDMFSDSVCAVMQIQKVFHYSETENLNKPNFLNLVGEQS